MHERADNRQTSISVTKEQRCAKECSGDGKKKQTDVGAK